MAELLAKLEGVSRVYQKGKERVDVLHELDLQIEKGDFLALMGPSGSGKTTLLNLLGGLDKATAGTVTVGGAELSSMSNSQLSKWRATHVGFIFQFYNLLPVLTARKNVELPLLLTNMSGKERARRADIALEIVGLADRAKHRPRELSGGQEQRVAIARAIVSDPQLLLCDEPTGDLDRTTADEILNLLKTLNTEHGKTIIMVTHDAQAAEYRAAYAAHGQGQAGSQDGGMKYFGLIWKNAWRKKIRTSLTVLSVLVAFLLFALLNSIGYAFRGGEDVSSAERLIVLNKISLINPLPISYQARIASTPGVEAVTHASWFGGYYQDPRNQFAQFPVDRQGLFRPVPGT